MRIAISVDPLDQELWERWDHGEFVRAIRGLGSLGLLGDLPDTLLHHLLAAEIVERIREAAAQGQPSVRVPWWPRALLEASPEPLSAGTEFEAILPPFSLEVRSASPIEHLQALDRCLAGRSFDPFAYERRLAAIVRDFGGIYRHESKPYAAQTVSAIVRRGHECLLERRAPDARVSPGLLDTFGGHIEAGETESAALARELHEELRITPRAARFLWAYEAFEVPPGALYLHGVWLVEAWTGELAPPTNGVWLPLSAALQDPALNPALRPALQRLAASASGAARAE